MSAFTDLFKRKVGGTVVGNILRGVVSNFSGGLLGNGLFMLKEGQSIEQNNQQSQQAIINGIIASNTTNNTQKQMKTITDFIENNKVLAYAMGAVVAFLVYTKFIKKSNSKW